MRAILGGFGTGGGDGGDDIWSSPSNGPGGMAYANTGGGGGGNAYPVPPNKIAGSGGSGIVICRYKISQAQFDATASAKATGGIITFKGSQVIHTFNSPGDFNNTSGSPISATYLIFCISTS